LNLHAVCYYRSKSATWTDPWTERHFLARNLVKGVKQQTFGGFSLLKLLSGKYLRLDNTPTGQTVALKFASQGLLKLLKDAGYDGAQIVPVPSSSHVNPNADFTGARIAAAVENRDPAFAARPVLYFAQPQPKSSAGGPRNTYELEKHLRITAAANLKQVVLLDDVMTTGAHLRAAARFLAKEGITVADAFVVARTIWNPKPSMFRCETETIAP